MTKEIRQGDEAKTSQTNRANEAPKRSQGVDAAYCDNCVHDRRWLQGSSFLSTTKLCPLHAAAPAMYEALKEARQMIFDLRGRAFVGSHAPRSQEPLLVGGTALDAKIDAALALATDNAPAQDLGN